MELFTAALAITGFCTLIASIDEYIDWVSSYHREGDDDHAYRTQHTDSYDRLCDQGYRE